MSKLETNLKSEIKREAHTSRVQFSASSRKTSMEWLNRGDAGGVESAPASGAVSRTLAVGLASFGRAGKSFAPSKTRAFCRKPLRSAVVAAGIFACRSAGLPSPVNQKLPNRNSLPRLLSRTLRSHLETPFQAPRTNPVAVQFACFSVISWSDTLNDGHQTSVFKHALSFLAVGLQDAASTSGKMPDATPKTRRLVAGRDGQVARSTLANPGFQHLNFEFRISNFLFS
ncbi:MAG: hypothetical protein N3B01_11795 [Verrucomicrobiae bacterium]|nr:hypothetical protein [Verrucomicrobiae bacterium]